MGATRTAKLALKIVTKIIDFPRIRSFAIGSLKISAFFCLIVYMQAAIYPGTFDPPTLGHLNIIQRASKKFDKLVVAIGDNVQKMAPTFPLAERIRFLEAITAPISNIEITSFKGLLVDFAQSRKIDIIVRAIRTVFDFEYETLQAQMNRQLGGVETFYLVVDEKYRLLSSTLVREIASNGKRLTAFVPPEIEEAVFHGLFKNQMA